MSRLQSQKLLEVVRQFEDFPVLLETWRTCLRDEFDLENLKTLLSELASGIIAWSGVKTAHPSPFARSDWWRQVNQYMYMDDRPVSDRASRLRRGLLREIVFEPGLRPSVSPELVERFESKRQRLSPGYSPHSARELLDWVKERLLIPQGEWERLLQAMERDHGLVRGPFLEELKEKLVRVHAPDALEPQVAAREMISPILVHGYGRGKEVGAESWDGRPLFGEGMLEETGEGEDLAWLLGQWLSFYGPKSAEFLRRTLGIAEDRLLPALEDLVDAEKAVQGRLITGGGPEDICDSENFEILLRIARVESQPVFEPLKIDRLAIFLADLQGIVNPKSGLETLRERIEQLLCYPAEAGFWEAEIFPGRLRPYDPSWLDTLMQEGDLKWVGAEGHRIVFCPAADLDLIKEESPVEGKGEEQEALGLRFPMSGGLADLFPDPGGRYDFATLVTRSRISPANLAEKLWESVWHGQLTNDTFLTLRRAVAERFKLPDQTSRERKPMRPWGRRSAGLGDRKGGRSFPGNWHLLSVPEFPDDLLGNEERKKEKIRILLGRYGILFRELLQRELPALSWPNLFRSLRIMELSGEVLAGYFFEGVPGPQFISPQAFGRLRRAFPEEKIFWVNGADPASLCGVPLESLKGMLPPRLAGTHLVYHGTRLAMVSKRYGKELNFLVPPDAPRLAETFGPLHHLLTRPFQPLRRIAVETINDDPAPQSPYLPALRAAFEVVVDYKFVNLSRPRNSAFPG